MEKREITLEELKIIQVNILKEIDKFCNENGLRYFLFSGTLLGAVRHKGYIPWDDDIDICMPRKDYDVFFQTFNKSRDDNLIAINHRNMKEYYLASGKVIDNATEMIEETNFKIPIGVYVDVFPMDNIPSSDVKLLMLNKRITPYRKLLQLKTITYRQGRALWKNVILCVGNILMKPIRVSWLVKKIDKLAMKYQNDYTCNRMADIAIFTYGLREVFLKEDFEQYIKLEFEGELYNAPIHYERVLASMYGDYMQLPSEDKRVRHHKFLAYWK